MSGPPVGVGDPRLMSLVSSSVAPSMWSRHGKEWLSFAGPLRNDWDEVHLRAVTASYLLCLRDRGVSATVAQRWLSGVRFHLLLRGYPDVSKSFIFRQALKRLEERGSLPGV